MTCPDQLAAQESTHSKAWTCPPSTTTTTTTAPESTPKPERPTLPTSTLEALTSPPWKPLQNRQLQPQPQPQPQQRQQQLQLPLPLRQPQLPQRPLLQRRPQQHPSPQRLSFRQQPWKS